MESLTPPLSSPSDEGRSPRPSDPRPQKRQRTECHGENETARAAPRTTSYSHHSTGGGGNFLTIHEESAELEKTDFHFPNLRAFVDELSFSCQAKWKTRSVPYNRAFALLVRWEEDDLGVIEEIEILEHMFRDTYNFDVETFAIPSTKRGYLGLVDRIKSLLDTYDVEDSLFILYYGGHACQDEQPQPTWVSKREDGSSFQSSAFLHLFVEMDADVLLLFDSCQAVPQAFDSTGKGVVSAITATGFEPGNVGIAAAVGPHSFTHALIQVLGVLSIPPEPSRQSDRAPPTDVLLHTLLITELKKSSLSLAKREDGSFRRDKNGHHIIEPFRRRTPIYHWLSRNKPHRQILLSPLRRMQDVGGSMPPPPPSKQQRPVLDTVVPEVLVAIRLAPDALGKMDIEAWTKWILSLPGGATKVSFEERAVKIEGLYRSFSSLLILKMPTETWDSLPKSKAMTFIGYVTGENLANDVNKRVDGILMGSAASSGENISEGVVMRDCEDSISRGLDDEVKSDQVLASTAVAKPELRRIGLSQRVKRDETPTAEVRTHPSPIRRPREISTDFNKAKPAGGLGHDLHQPILHHLQGSSKSDLIPNQNSFDSAKISSTVHATPLNMGLFSTRQLETVPPLMSTTTLGALYYVDVIQQNLGSLAHGAPIQVDINGTLDKGFFLSDNEWTCYRRNYFSCVCSYDLRPNYANRAVIFRPTSCAQTYCVYDFAVSISAVASNDDAHNIDLVQHIPRSNKSPIIKPEKVRLSAKPRSSPYPGQSALGQFPGDATTQSNSDQNILHPHTLHAATEHVFDRVQFKQATANNGKRRAPQQYYHLVVELWADVGSQASDNWVKVAQRKSAKLIVRGRSPSHYQAKRRGSVSSVPGGSAGGLGYSGSQDTDSGFGSSSSAMLSSADSGGYDQRPASHYGTHSRTAEEAMAVTQTRDYQYYPAPIYEGVEIDEWDLL